MLLPDTKNKTRMQVMLDFISYDIGGMYLLCNIEPNNVRWRKFGWIWNDMNSIELRIEYRRKSLSRIKEILREMEEKEEKQRKEDLLIEDRREHCKFIVKPMLDCGFWVFCDRFTPSTLAYQGYGHGLDLPRIERVNNDATGGLKPDLTIILDCFVENAISRKTEPLDCMEVDRPSIS